MLVTVAIVVATHNLALGVVAGVLLSVIVYAYRSASQLLVHKESGKGETVYRVQGQLFFVSSEALLDHVDFADEADHVCIDLNGAHVWDHTARQTIDKIVARLTEKGKRVTVIQPKNKDAGKVKKLA